MLRRVASGWTVSCGAGEFYQDVVDLVGDVDGAFCPAGGALGDGPVERHPHRAVRVDRPCGADQFGVVGDPLRVVVDRGEQGGVDDEKEKAGLLPFPWVGPAMVGALGACRVGLSAAAPLGGLGSRLGSGRGESPGPGHCLSAAAERGVTFCDGSGVELLYEGGDGLFIVGLDAGG